MKTASYKSIKISASTQEHRTDVLVLEAPLQININGSPYTVVMRTPGNDIELTRGLLYAEDIYKGADELLTKISEKEHHFNTIDVQIPKELLGKGYLTKRSLLSVSSCGICGKQQLEDLTVSGKTLSGSPSISLERVPDMFSKMTKLQKTFQQTGGSHAAAVFSLDEELLIIQEDIGRHNAVDKCIGGLLEQGILKKANSLFVSGRVSYEIISKAFFAKIPIIVAVSACSSLAVDFAKEFGITLIGFSRGNQMTVYTNGSAIKKEAND